MADYTELAAAEASRRYYTTVDKLLGKVEDAVTLIEPSEIYDIRQLAAALKDISTIKGLKSDGDRREQEARIAKLRREAERGDGEDGGVEIKLAPELEEYGV